MKTTDTQSAKLKKSLKLSAICGMIASAFFGGMVVFEQLIVPGYSWTT
jgi:hypothetical protein